MNKIIWAPKPWLCAVSGLYYPVIHIRDYIKPWNSDPYYTPGNFNIALSKFMLGRLFWGGVFSGLNSLWNVPISWSFGLVHVAKPRKPWLNALRMPEANRRKWDVRWCVDSSMKWLMINVYLMFLYTSIVWILYELFLQLLCCCYHHSHFFLFFDERNAQQHPWC